jgi:hypothetical protein
MGDYGQVPHSMFIVIPSNLFSGQGTFLNALNNLK